MRFIDNVATYLAANSIGTVATDLFIGILPPTPDNAVMVDYTGGLEPDRYAPVRKLTVQTTVRNTDYDDGYDKIQAIFDLLHRKLDDLELETGGVDVMEVMALQEPTFIGQDETNRYVFTCNFLFMVRGDVA